MASAQLTTLYLSLPPSRDVYLYFERSITSFAFLFLSLGITAHCLAERICINVRTNGAIFTGSLHHYLYRVISTLVPH